MIYGMKSKTGWSLTLAAGTLVLAAVVAEVLVCIGGNPIAAMLAIGHALTLIP
jgi:hypothetical protein